MHKMTPELQAHLWQKFTGTNAPTITALPRSLKVGRPVTAATTPPPLRMAQCARLRWWGLWGPSGQRGRPGRGAAPLWWMCHQRVPPHR
jgi:hypothetical protein